MSKHATVVILDYGSQYTQLIARRVRELSIYSVVLPGDATLDEIQSHQPRALVLSGGPSSVFDEGAPKLPDGLLDYQKNAGIPTLGICYGMQLLVQSLGGKVVSSDGREYGRMLVNPSQGSSFFSSADSFQAWMSHGDRIEKLPDHFNEVARSQSGVPAAIEAPEDQIYALQFHPEVTHTEKGMKLLKNFFLHVAKIRPDWTMDSIVEEHVEWIKEKVGAEGHAICALSGGVDSAVAAAIVHRALGDRLHCVFVDHGLLRFKEQERVMEMFEKELRLPVQCVDASERFLSKLDGVSDPEEKRKIIGTEFIRVFEEAADELTEKLGSRPSFLVQGTLYPDVIESSPPPLIADAKGKVRKFAAKIKSHHNVGGLPVDMKFQLIEPLCDLFKDEVRRLGAELEVPKSFLKRHPFPGPGLAVRILGEITPERIEILQNADEIFIQSMKDAGLYDEIWQAFAVFLPIRTVGVQGDGRTHDYVIGLRAVTSTDGMTADWFSFPESYLREVSSRICNEVRGVSRVVYDISSKPPATIEWE